jgi:two-component system, cell cycle sensor histidine kinase and response regulator CckA
MKERNLETAAVEKASDLSMILSESQRHFTTILTNLDMIVVMIDVHGNIAFCNDYLLRLTGWEREETIGRSWFEMFLPEHEHRRVGKILDDILPQGTVTPHFVSAIKTRSGESRLVKWTNTTLRDSDDRFIGLVALGDDITDHERIEQELRKSEERYRDLVENARDIIYTHDLEGNYTSINQCGEQITGYTRDETLKMNIAQTIAPEFLVTARQMIDRKFAGEKVTAYELEILAKDGRRVMVEVNTKLIFQDNVPVSVQGIARDITERKLLEEQLRQAQKLEAVGQLAGGIAHDFNNMLTAIIGYSELGLRKLPAEDPLRHTFEEINRAGTRAASLTRQLLAFSRKQILQPKIIDLNSLVSDLQNMLERLIGEHIDLRTLLEPELGRVEADPGQIEQVILNLVLNARDAMERGGKLTIETTNVYLDEEYIASHMRIKPGAYVRLAVSDNGTGIDAPTQARIFEPFFTTKESGKGTGLGLATVYGIVKQSGGFIWVYSEPGYGTTFKIYLPLVGAPAGEHHRPPRPAAPLPGARTVLLVEDEETVRKLVCEVLKLNGVQVIGAASGEEAISVCEQHPEQIDLLITDVVMPEMSGSELAERLASTHPEMKVLYMSGYTDDAIVHHGILNSEITFIQKPFTAANLVSEVSKALVIERE